MKTTWKWILNGLGLLLILSGCVWFLQGIGVLPGSFMSGQLQWAVNGGIAVVIGAAILFLTNRRQSKQH